MTFQRDHMAAAAGPLAQCLGQGRQQQVVDTGAEGRRRVVKQPLGLLFIKRHSQVIAVGNTCCAIRVVARQCGIFGRKFLPMRQFLVKAPISQIPVQVVHPVMQTADFPVQFDGSATCGLLVGKLQVLKQHPPGDTIHRQVMGGDQ